MCPPNVIFALTASIFWVQHFQRTFQLKTFWYTTKLINVTTLSPTNQSEAEVGFMIAELLTMVEKKLIFQ